MTSDDTAPSRRTDLGITIVLIIVWLTGIAVVSARQPDFPRSMLIIGTIFFVVLIPAMKDLVRAIEKWLGAADAPDTD